jgi:hypothetical protein
MAILDGVVRTHIHFNPAAHEHRAIYWKLRTTGRQDPDVRFILEEGFSSVMTMMQTKLADHYSRPQNYEHIVYGWQKGKLGVIK